MNSKRPLNKEYFSKESKQNYYQQKEYKQKKQQISKPKKHIDEYKPSGNLYKNMKRKDGRILNYCEPIDSYQPEEKWRIYVFEGDKEIQTPILLHDKPFYVFGQDEKQVDCLLSHETIDNQHAIVQFRKRMNKKQNKEEIIPYLIDLHSHEGTFLNGKKIKEDTFIELLSGDQISFGKCNLLYMILNENMKL